MTTIRISRLPEIKNDRVSSDDYLIINDGDIVTSKVTFEEFVFAIGAQDIDFTGDITYSGDVNFDGQISGDFYLKSETYNKNEINLLIKDLTDYNTLQDARITALQTLTGRPSLSTDLGTFPGVVIPDHTNITGAFEVLDSWTTENRTRIEAIEQTHSGVTTDIEALELRVEKIEDALGDPDNVVTPDLSLPAPDGALNQLAYLLAKSDDVGSLVDLLGLARAQHDGDANANLVKEGFIYFQKDDLSADDSTGLLKVKGINTGTNPRA